MPEEKTPQLPVSPQVRQPADQIQALSLLDKLKLQKKKILIGILGVLVFAGAVFGAYQLGQRQLYPEPAEGPTPEVVATPTPDPTANWRTYKNNELSFQYPEHWIIETDRIIGTDPNAVIYVVSKDSTLMNECMKLDTTEKKDGLVIKKFSRVTTGEMCSTSDSSPREIWVVPTEGDYSPGISYSYTIKDNPEVEDTFSLILSTFKFLEGGETGEYQIFGWFTKEASDDDIKTLEGTILRYLTSPISIMESFPPQFQIITPDKESCEEVRKVLPGFKFVGRFGECRERETPVNPEEPVENPMSPGE